MTPAAAVRPRDNPFATSRIHALGWRPPPAAGAPGREELVARLDEMGGRGALVGPHGHGKTTLLHELADRLARRTPMLEIRRLAAGRERRPPQRELRRFAAAVGPRHLLLVDGADHLPAPTWWRLRLTARRAAGLLVTTHRPGRLPTLLHCATSPALLAELIAELLAGAPPPVPLPSAEELHRRHAGNVRDALHELYDRCAGRWRPGNAADR